MQKNTQLLKWALLLLTLLVIGVTSLSGKLSVTQADTTPPPGSCQLSWKGANGGGGLTDLDFSKVTDDGLKKTLEGQGTPPGPGYNLKCAEQHTRCQLVSGSSNDSGSIKLDLANIQTSSSWLYTALLNKYGLSCDNRQVTKQLSKQKAKAKKKAKKKANSSSSSSSSSSTCLGSSTLPNSSSTPPIPSSTPPSTVNVNGSSTLPNSSSTLPNSDCNSNTPAPSAGSCQVAWKNGGGGTTNLDLDQVTNTGLQQTLAGTGTANPPGYNLKCAEQHTACELILGTSGDTKLDLANVQNRSPWIYQQLVGYSLKCNSDTDGH